MSFQLPTTSLSAVYERNQEATVYISNLDSKVTDDLLLELFLQCGPVVSIHIPKDRITGEHSGFGFLEFRNEDDCDYAINILNQIKLYGKPMKLNKASQDKRSQEIGANLFIGNLADDVDENIIKEVFSQFGNILLIRIARDSNLVSKHYGFVNFDRFESSDTAIKIMNGQYMNGKKIKVEYALREGSVTERHGSLAERILAANKVNSSKVFGQNDGVNSQPQHLPIFPVLPLNLNINTVGVQNIIPPIYR